MSLDLDQVEALAKAAMTDHEDPSWFDVGILNDFLLVEGETECCGPFIAALNPAVVLQWVAETRALRQERAVLKEDYDEAFAEAEERDNLRDKLRAAVEALGIIKDWCDSERIWSRDELRDLVNVTLAILSGHAGGQGEGER